MQGAKVQITLSALLDSVQMQSSKQSLKHFHTPRTDLFLNCLQLLEAFEWLLGVSKRKWEESNAVQQAQNKIPQKKINLAPYILL